MKVVAYMAATPNGFIATPEGDTGWVSSADWDNYKNMVRQAGAVIMGRNTYDAMVAEKSFPLPDALNLIMTREAPPVEPLKNVVFESGSPEEVLAELQKMGRTEVILGGGGELLGSFLADGLIDELYLTLEPVVFGDGLRLLGSGDFVRQLELLDVKKLGENGVQLHYAIVRK